jgi:hypothetical protein
MSGVGLERLALTAAPPRQLTVVFPVDRRKRVQLEPVLE